MYKHDDFAAIAALDLDPIKVKLMHAQSGEGWSREKADAVEFEYRRFLYLMKKFPQENSAPLFDVDTFWHYHILDTMKYMEDCQVVFGHYLHHFPYLGLRGEDDDALHEQAGERMKQLYDATFGSDSFARAASQISGQRAGVTAWSYVPPAQLTTAWSYVPPAQVVTAWSYVPPGQAIAGTRTSAALPRPTI
ncbi:MAG TPA: glycine-rich domain-containing protein-like [Telluria sp.]|nr:glycine-rich domain-containing protein-like [Telluria sp.]